MSCNVSIESLENHNPKPLILETNKVGIRLIVDNHPDQTGQSQIETRDRPALHCTLFRKKVTHNLGS